MTFIIIIITSVQQVSSSKLKQHNHTSIDIVDFNPDSNFPVFHKKTRLGQNLVPCVAKLLQA